MGGTQAATLTGTEDRVAHFEQRLAIPVILAAVASVPAMFLAMFEGSPALVGNGLNYASLAVLTAETVILFAASGDKLTWLRRHWFIVGVTIVAVPAVIFAVGPAQLLRLLRFVRFVGALRILRVRRIIKAGQILRRRAGLTGPLANAIVIGVTVLSALFVALVLADPTSTSREIVDAALGRLGVAGLLLAGVILAASTFVVVRYRNGAEGDTDGTESRAAQPETGP